MPRIDPPYPTFTSVMSTSGLPAIDTSRLPSYRSTHVVRFHPYPTTMRRRDQEDALMATVDYRWGLEPILEEPEPTRLRPTVFCEESLNGDVSSFELDQPVVGDVFFENGADEQAAPTKLGALFASITMKLRRRYLAILGASAHLVAKNRN